MGLAAICARNAATGSAAGACCAGKGTAPRKRDTGKSWARNALPASVAESRSIVRRDVGFRKELGSMRFHPFALNWVLPGLGRHYTAFSRDKRSGVIPSLLAATYLLPARRRRASRAGEARDRDKKFAMSIAKGAKRD